MTNKGFTLVELLIVVVVMSIIAAFSGVLVNEIVENTRQSSFIVSANTFIDAAEISYLQDEPMWDDNTATLADIIAAGYVSIGPKDPWNGQYDFNASYVIVIISQSDSSTVDKLSFKIKLISTTATLGYDEELAVYSKDDIVFLDGSSTSLVDKIISIFDRNLKEDLTTDNGDDDISVNGDISSGAVINTLDGDDTITIGDDIKDSSTLDMGAGNDTLILGDDIRDGSSVFMGDGDDTIIMDGEITGSSSIDTGDGNDTIIIKDDIQDNATVTTGTGNDTVTVDETIYAGAVLDTGTGNDIVTAKIVESDATVDTGDGDDTLTITNRLSDATLLTGDGNDTLTVDYIRNDSTINTGEDNDALYIRNVSSTFDGQVLLGPGNDTLTLSDGLSRTVGTFDGGSGYDILYLPNIPLSKWNDYASSLFSNFEKVVLEDEILTF